MKIEKGRRKELEIKASILIERKTHEYLKTQEKIILAIPGGTSITGILTLLKTQNMPWEKVHLFFADERVIESNSQDSNYNQACILFLDYLTKQKKLPLKNIHPYNYFNLPIQKSLDAYKNELREISHRFDIVLLSSGEDGHVGSLFPNHESINNQTEYFIHVTNSPKPPNERISASRKLLEKSKTAILLFFGESKKQAFQNFSDKNLSVMDCPAKLVYNMQDSYVFTDQ